MRIISISGLDGSGKSTQAELLKKHLESRGGRIFYFHAIEQSFAKKLQDFKKKYCLICKLTGKCKTSSVEEKSVIKANWIQIQLRKMFLLIDILRFKNFIKKAEFDYILSDRYFFDSAINIKYLSKKDSSLFAEKFIPSPDLKIYLDAEPAIIMQRKRVPDQGIEYLQAKRNLLENNFNKYGLTKIDGNRNPEEIFEEILSEITKLQEAKNKQ